MGKARISDRIFILEACPEKKNNPLIADLTAETDNFFFGFFVVFDFYFFNNFGVHPKIGGGYILQNSRVTGEIKSDIGNSFPFTGFGVDFSYRLNRFVSIALNMQSYVEIEEGTATLLNTITFGVDLKI